MEEEREVTTRAFRVYGCPLEMVNYFRYLGRVISTVGYDCTEMVSNLSRVREVWKRMTRNLIREGAVPWVSGFFFKAVVKAVLLFGSETWVVTSRMGNDLGGFQDQVSRQMMGMIPRRKPDSKWVYISTATARYEAGLLEMGDYIWRQQNTVSH